MYMFEYKAKMKHLPYFDKFPLVYVLKSSRSEFWGLNLHYLTPKRRIQATKKLIQGRIDFPKKCFHKYLQPHVEGLLLDLAASEWDTAILLPTEDFVKEINGLSFSIKKEDVWKETNESFYDKIRGQRIVRGYGTTQSREMAT
jgi:protoheme ferro-lyase